MKKPPSISSAQVLRDLQHAFAKSKTFGPLLSQTKARESLNKHRSKRRRVDDENMFRMGHGGTLDPMATGVLIVGIGRGTKFLPHFLDCTKTYETVVLFGKSTDTYDVSGTVVASAETAHIHRRLVEEKLAAFRGQIKQVPPIYSALKIDGMKAYDYARTGRELPRELPARDMTVTECELVDWYEPAKHEYRWPAVEADSADKAVFQKLVHGADATVKKRDPKPASPDDGRNEKESRLNTAPEAQETSRLELPRSPKPARQQLSQKEKAALHTHEITGLSEEIAKAPAARIRLTVSSGFYVRSFAHDLGLACGSYGTMAELARTRQANFTTALPPPADLMPTLDHADLSAGEDVWGPRVTKILDAWLASNPPPENKRRDSRHRSPSYDKSPGSKWQSRDKDNQKRRNSSSPEA